MAQEFSKPFYDSALWQRTRKEILRRDNYSCADCGGRADMDAKAFFKSALDVERDIIALMARRQHRLDVLVGHGIGETIRSPGNHSPTESAGIAIADIDAKIAEKQAEYAEIVRQQDRVIEQLKNPKHRQVLSYRYQSNMGWDDVADAMGYTDRRSATRMHGWALITAKEILEKM